MIVMKAYTKPRPIIHRYKGIRTNEKPVKAPHSSKKPDEGPKDIPSNLPDCLQLIVDSICNFYQAQDTECANLLNDEKIKDSILQAANAIELLEKSSEDLKDIADSTNQQQQNFQQSDELIVLQNEIDALRKELETRNVLIKQLEEEKEKLESSLIQWPGDFSPSDLQTNVKRDQKKSRKQKTYTQKDVSKAANSDKTSEYDEASKVAEMHADLFDQEWRSAYGILLKSYGDEKNVTEKLLTIFNECYQCCWLLSREQLEKIHKLLVVPEKIYKKEAIPQSSEAANDYIYNISKNEVKLIKDIRKMTGGVVLHKLSQNFMQEWSDFFMKEKDNILEQYTIQCFEVCWLACIQDSPLTFKTDFPKGFPIDNATTVSFKNTGKTIDYVVWPGLLKTNGNVLARGVVNTI